MKSKMKGEKNIKIKVFVSYAVIVILISAILYFTFDSFQKLTRSTDTLAKPNARIGLLHDIISSIYNAESHIRSYSLNDEERYLEDYFNELSTINEKVDSLYLLAQGDEFIIQTIDSINAELLSKTELLDQFMQVKKMNQGSAFYEQALNEILQATQEESRVKEITHQSVISDLPPQEKEQQTQEDIAQEKDNFFTRIRNFFTGGSSEDSSDDEEQLQESDERVAREVLHQIQTDSIITVYRDTEELMRDIEVTMMNMMNSMLKREQNIRRMENNILIEDKKVMDRIWEYITILEEYESANALKEAERAHATVQITTEKIFIIVVVSLLTLLLFSWLFVNDVNKSRFLKRQLIREKARAEDLLQVKQRFMANISHEIRTPLNSIVGFSDQLRKENLKSRSRKFVDAVSQSSYHLLQIVNDILDFSKMEAGKISLNRVPFNMNVILEEVHASLAVIAGEKNISFEMDSSELNNPNRMGDPLRIKQIILNISFNAIKFTHQGFVKIHVSDSDPETDSGQNPVKIRVSDSGIGIAEDAQKRIFEEFAQGDTQASRNYGGTGLGLSISKKLVELMQGTISVSSQQGKGSVFCVDLPMKVSEQPVEPEKAVPVAIQSGTVARILLVDDDRLNRMLFQSLFSSYEGITITEAKDASQGFQYLKSQQFDLIITDIQMPGTTGIEMAKQFRSHAGELNDRTPWLACTADITPETLQEIKENGMEDYLQKPLDEDILLKKVMELLHHFRPDDFVFQNQPQATPSSLKELPVREKDYSLEGLKAFTGNDPEALRTVIETFTQDTKEHLAKLENSAKRVNRQEVKQVVHNMSNMFGLLKAQKVMTHLRETDVLLQGSFSEKQWKATMHNLVDSTEKLIESLSTDMEIFTEPDTLNSKD